MVTRSMTAEKIKLEKIKLSLEEVQKLTKKSNIKEKVSKSKIEEKTIKNKSMTQERLESDIDVSKIINEEINSIYNTSSLINIYNNCEKELEGNNKEKFNLVNQIISNHKIIMSTNEIETKKSWNWDIEKLNITPQ